MGNRGQADGGVQCNCWADGGACNHSLGDDGGWLPIGEESLDNG